MKAKQPSSMSRFVPCDVSGGPPGRKRHTTPTRTCSFQTIEILQVHATQTQTKQNGQFRMIAKDWKPARSLSQTQDFIKVGESGRPDASQIPHGQKICKELSGQNWKATTRTTPTRTQLRWTWKGYCILLFFSNDSTHSGDIHNSWNCSSPRHTNTTTNPASETILCPFNFFCNVRTFEINAPQTISDLSSLISSLRYRMVVGSWAPLSGWTPRPFGLAAFWMLKQIVWTQLANGTGQLAFGSF